MEEDRFIEVHVFGSMTARSFESVCVEKKKRSQQERVLLTAVNEKLAKVGIAINFIGNA